MKRNYEFDDEDKGKTMGQLEKIEITTSGEKFYEITIAVEEKLKTILKKYPSNPEGLLYLFLPHTSCGLCLSEAYDPSARKDLENFLNSLAHPNLPFIKHTAEGPDDSPSHMKSLLLQQSLVLAVENRNLVLGQWQGIFLAEFREKPHQRKIMLKFIPDPLS